MAVKWSKLIINLSNSIYAITGLSINELRNSAEGRTFMADVWDEGLDVLEAAGIRQAPIPGRPAQREEARLLREPAAPQPLPEDPDLKYYPSTWQDLALQRGSTESAYLNGEIVTLGRALSCGHAPQPPAAGGRRRDGPERRASRQIHPGRFARHGAREGVGSLIHTELGFYPPPGRSWTLVEVTLNCVI